MGMEPAVKGSAATVNRADHPAGVLDGCLGILKNRTPYLFAFSEEALFYNEYWI